VEFSLRSLQRDLGQPLQESFLAPLSVLQYPWMIAVNALALGYMIYMPLSIAVMHRFSLALLGAVLVGVLGHTPVLAATVATGCLIVTQTPLRRDIPFLAAVIGMIPVGIYLYLSGLTGTGAETALPIQRWAIRAPLAGAAVVGVTALAVTIGLSAWANFRPLVFWLLVTLSPALPIVTFYTQTGQAELEYRLIASSLSLDSQLFPALSMEQWRSRARAEGLQEPALLARAKDHLTQRQMELIARCEHFLGLYAEHERAAEIAWVRAQAASLQLDRRAYAAGRIRYICESVDEEVRPLWGELLAKYPLSRAAALARWRLADIELCAGRIEEADKLLDEAIESLRQALREQRSRRESRRGRVFDPRRRLPRPDALEYALLQSRTLKWLIEQNNALNDPAAAEAISAWRGLDPHVLTAERYREQLARLAQTYADTAFGANLRVAQALCLDDLTARAEALLALAEQGSDVDAAVQANYELGLLAIQAPDLLADERFKTAAEYFRLVQLAPPSPFSDRVESLESQAARPAENAS
jgi:hypothetical protein